MRKITIGLLSAMAFAPLLAHAQPENKNTPMTSADARQVYNATLYQGKLTVDAVNALGVKLDALIAAMKAGGTGTAPPPSDGGSTTPPPPTDTGGSVVPGQVPAVVGTVSGNVLTLKAGIEPADATSYLQSGWTLIAQPGRFLKPFGITAPLDNITIKCSTPGKCVMDGQGGNGNGHRLLWGKACILVSDASVTIQGFAFKHCGSPLGGNSYANEAAIYFDGTATDAKKTASSVVTIDQNLFDGNGNAIFGAGMSGGKIVVSGNVFGLHEPNGLNGALVRTASGAAHDMYVQLGASGVLDVSGNFFYGSAGHNVKARTGNVSVHDNPVMTYDGGRVADVSDGGKLDFTNNSVWNRDDAIFPPRTLPTAAYAAAWQPYVGAFGNSNVIASGDESLALGAPTGTISGNKFNISRQGSTIWINTAGAMAANDNQLNFFTGAGTSFPGPGSLIIQGIVTGLAGASAPPGAPAHAPAPPAPPAWATN